MEHGSTPRRASEWLAALTTEPDDRDLRPRFDAWLAADPANATDWAEILRTYEVMGMTPPMHREHWESFAARHRPATLPLPGAAAPGRPPAGVFPFPGRPLRGADARRRRRIAYGLAGAAVAACLALAVLSPALLRLRADYATATAQVRTVTLADGSTVHLGPQSAIDVAFSDDSRQVRLLKGEAFFEVVHDAARPFSVTAGGVRTTDVGTAFEVRRDGGDTDVGVRRGAVRVDDPDAAPPLSRQLGAGQWLRIGADGQAFAGSDAPQDIASWLDGQIVARNQPVGAVVDELRRYYGGFVILRGQALAAQPITGVFNVADPVAALRAVARSQGARLIHPLPWVVIIAGR